MGCGFAQDLWEGFRFWQNSDQVWQMGWWLDGCFNTYQYFLLRPFEAKLVSSYHTLISSASGALGVVPFSDIVLVVVRSVQR